MNRATTYLILTTLTLALLGAGCTGPRKGLHITKGDERMRLGDYTLAADHYRQASEQDPSDTAGMRLAVALIQAGRHSEALGELAKIKQDSYRSLYLKALCCVALNDVSNAERLIEQALQEKPDDCQTLALLGRVKFLQREYDRSAEAYQRALANSAEGRTRTKLHYDLAMAKLSAGHFNEADDAFKLYLVEQKFVTQEDHRMAGAIAYAAGDRQRAFRHWKTLGTQEQQQILNALGEQAESIAEVATAN